MQQYLSLIGFGAPPQAGLECQALSLLKEALMTKDTKIDLAALGVIFSLGFLAIATALIA